MKKSIAVSLINEKYINALMTKLKFVEVDRVATGGMHSDEKLLITYEGNSSDYHEMDYVQLPKLPSGNRIFHSILLPDGCLCKSSNDFKNFHDKSNVDFEIKTF